jgi:hypothetical protein
MARTSQEKQALIERLEASRNELADQVAELRRRFDIPARFGDSVRRSPLRWFGASAGVGLVASHLLRRPWKKKRLPKIFGILATTAFGVLKPRLLQVITSELQRRFMSDADAKRSESPGTFPLSKP